MILSNLTQLARQQYRKEIRRSGQVFGKDVARRMADALISKCDDIAAGLNHGHRRADLPDQIRFRFLTVKSLSIVYDPETRVVVGILDSRRDFTRLFR